MVKKEKELKKAADEILSEVHRKLTEARRGLTILGHLRKLRQLRKEKSQQRGINYSWSCYTTTKNTKS